MITSLNEFEGINFNGSDINEVVFNGVKVWGGASSLPEGYTKLDYIEATGTQFINLINVYPTDDVEWETSIQWVGDMEPGNRWFMGMGTNPNAYWGRIYSKSTNSILYELNGSAKAGVTPATKTFDHVVYTFNHETLINTLTVNGTDLGTSNSSYVSTATYRPLALLGISGRGTCKARVQYTNVWINGELVRGMIPCKNTENVVGMYDTVNGVFYDNDGTGEFICETTESEVEVNEFTN